METKDALLHAINEEFVEAVEVLLDHEETIHKPGELHVSLINFPPSLQVNLFQKCIFLSKFFWPTVRKNCSSDREKLLKFEAEVREFAKILRSLWQFTQTVKGQKYFGNRMLF